MRDKSIPEDVAHKIYDTLVEHVPLKEHFNEVDGLNHHRETFVHYATTGRWTEYRIQGPFGFGGKVWNSHNRWYVNCYREHETPSTLSAQARTNAALAALYEAHYGEPMRAD